MSFPRRTAMRILVILLPAILNPILAGAVETAADYDALLVRMLEGYQELISVRLDEDIEDLPGRSWRLVAEAINRGFLRFSVDPAADSLLQGARFRAEPGVNVTYLIVTRNLLDTWKTYPSTCYSILTAAVRDAAVFFQDPPAWGLARQDAMSSMFMRLDQHAASAALIRDRLLPSAYLLSPYDAYILDSFEKDGLASVILYLDVYSLPVAEGLLSARTAYEVEPSPEEMRKFLNDLGNELLRNRRSVPTGTSDDELYPLAVAVHTWLEFSPYLIARIHNRDRQDNPLTFDQILAREKDYAEVRQRLETSRITDMPLMNHVHTGTVKGFEAIDGR